MSRRTKVTPEGADLLYSALIECEPRDGLVHIAVQSGEHIERGAIPMRVAMQLYLRLGAIFKTTRTAAPTCIQCGGLKLPAAH